jgi:hypothetical protein
MYIHIYQDIYIILRHICIYITLGHIYLYITLGHIYIYIVLGHTYVLGPAVQHSANA